MQKMTDNIVRITKGNVSMTKEQLEQLESRLDDVCLKIHHEGGRVVEKKGIFWTILHYIVMVVTFGSNRNFLKGYYTTIGGIVGYPEGWEKRSLESRIAVLEHELVHIRQCAKLGFGNVWVGFPIYMILYLFLPLPIGLAYFRYRYEREAYAHGINVRTEMNPEHYDRLIDGAVKQLTSGAYGWTWVFSKRVRAYFEWHCPDRRIRYLVDGLVTRDVQ
jgi:hypothetical protein